MIIDYGCDYTRSFSLTIVTRCFCKAPWKRFSFYFPFSPWRYHMFIKFVEIIHPWSLLVSFVTWPEYSALIRQNGFIGFFSKITRALVGFCSNSRCLESGQYRLFWQNVFRVQIGLYVENNARQSFSWKCRLSFFANELFIYLIYINIMLNLWLNFILYIIIVVNKYLIGYKENSHLLRWHH